MSFIHYPHPRTKGARPAPPKVEDQHGPGFNGWLASKITAGVGTMWCAYAFAALALLSLPDAIKAGKPAIISWIAQTFLQLVLLSIILVGQAVQAAAADKRAEATYLDAEAVLHEALEIQRHLQAQDELLRRIMNPTKKTAPAKKAAPAKKTTAR